MTTFTQSDPQQVVLDTMRALELSIGTFAPFTPYNRWTLERILRNERALTDYEGEQLKRIAGELVDLQHSFEIALDFRDVNAIKRILARRREQQKQLVAE